MLAHRTAVRLGVSGVRSNGAMARKARGREARVSAETWLHKRPMPLNPQFSLGSIRATVQTGRAPEDRPAGATRLAALECLATA